MDTQRIQLTVMQALGDPAKGLGTANPYTRLLVDSLPTNKIRTTYFSWSTIFINKFDIFHVHWPELLFRHKFAAVRWLKCITFLIFIARIKVQRKAIVRTIHNLTPHESIPWLTSRVIRVLDKNTSLWIILNESTPVPSPDHKALIPHGHYRDWYAEPSSSKRITGRLLTFGLIRAYKGVDDLLRAFRDTPEWVTLSIAGRPDSHQTSQEIRELSEGDDRISLTLKFLTDEELSEEVAKSSLVVLPYREVHNSGVALLALSLNRPILVRDAPATRLLAEEFGTDWVKLFSGDLTPDVLETAIISTSHTPASARVDMSTRDWKLLASRLVDAYERAAAAVIDP